MIGKMRIPKTRGAHLYITDAGLPFVALGIFCKNGTNIPFIVTVDVLLLP